MSYLKELLGDAYKEGMTEDEISAALERANAGQRKTDLDKLKAQLSRANAEAASFKNQLRDRQTAEEQAQAEREEALENLRQENEGLKRDISLAQWTAKLLATGYEEELARTTATAMVDGDMDAVLAGQSQYLETQKKQIMADQMRRTPRPAAGAPENGIDYGKKISEAQQSGNFAAAAYYTRLQAQEEEDNES